MQPRFTPFVATSGLDTGSDQIFKILATRPSTSQHLLGFARTLGIHSLRGVDPDAQFVRADTGNRLLSAPNVMNIVRYVGDDPAHTIADMLSLNKYFGSKVGAVMMDSRFSDPDQLLELRSSFPAMRWMVHYRLSLLSQLRSAPAAFLASVTQFNTLATDVILELTGARDTALSEGYDELTTALAREHAASRFSFTVGYSGALTAALVAARVPRLASDYDGKISLLQLPEEGESRVGNMSALFFARAAFAALEHPVVQT